jgi:hypothetical protein
MFDILFAAEQSVTQSIDPLIAMELCVIKMSRAGDIRAIADIISEMRSMEAGEGGVPFGGGGKGDGEARKKKELSDPTPQERGPRPVEPGEHPGDAHRPRLEVDGGVSGFLSFLENKDPRMHSLITQQGTIVLEGERLVVRLPRGSSFIEYLNDAERAQKLREELSYYFKRPMEFTTEQVSAPESEAARPSKTTTGDKTAPGPPGGSSTDGRQKLINSDTARHIFEVFEDVDVKEYTPGKK